MITEMKCSAFKAEMSFQNPDWTLLSQMKTGLTSLFIPIPTKRQIVRIYEQFVFFQTCA